MNLKQLEYVVAAIEAKSITAAAKKLHIAQPPLSRQISLLEEELGAKLLKRSAKGIEATQAGKIMYQKAHEIFNNINEMIEMIDETNEGIRGEIKIGSIYSALPVFANKLQAFQQEYPLINTHIMHGDPIQLMEWMSHGQIDLMFLRSPTCETGNYHYQILEEDFLVLVMHKDLDPAPHQDEIAIEQLRNIPLCMLRSGKFWGYNEFLVNECHKHGFSPNIVCECHDTSVALALVMAKLGISYQPRSIVNLLANPDIYIKPIKDFTIKTYPTLVWNDDIYLSRAIRLFLSRFGVKSQHLL